MTVQDEINYERIAEAIDYIRHNFKEQPTLDEVAEKVHISPYHFQRLFTEWAGVSPKKFLQYLSVEYAKSVLQEKHSTLFDAAYETGLSGTGRLHDLFVSIEGMTPGEFRNGGGALSINYSFAESPFGDVLVASTSKGICHLTFVDDREKAFAHLQTRFPNAQYRQMVDIHQQNALYIFTRDWNELSGIKLHLKGTPFQLKVWEALLKIPMGNLSTYSAVASAVDSPSASRAVGTAVGSNPVAFLIPCHRIIKSTGEIGEYHWGSTRKMAMIGWEAASVQR
jgi:AraC family transcriptional regulator of adaptative response/methylated-DNA-[protein]-cysteine methyltransferase